MCSLPVFVGLFVLLFQGWLTDELVRAIVPEASPIHDQRAFATRFVLLSGAALIYSLVCIASILYYALRVRSIRQAPGAPDFSWIPVWLLAASSVLFFGCYFLFPEVLSISAVTLKPTLDLYEQHTSVTSTIGARGVLLVSIPSLFGVVAAILSAVHGSLTTKGALVRFGADRKASHRAVEPAHREVLNGMMALSVVLIGSVLLVTLHVHAHAPLLPEDLRPQYEHFASFVSVFWGIALTIVAASACVPQLFALLYLRRLVAASGEPLRNETGRSALVEKLEMGLSVFGPFMVAFLGWLAERVLR